VSLFVSAEEDKVAKWARNNKMSFNNQKTKVIIITKKKPKNRRESNILLNNKKLQQVDTLKYLGITIDRRFNFNKHIDDITGKCLKIIHALAKSAKINWGLRHDILRIIYKGGNTPYFSIRSTNMDSVPKEETQRHKSQKGAETDKYKNCESISHYLP
jgi:hypothetical protein